MSVGLQPRREVGQNHVSLTRRERDILQLVPEELTNAEIAERLVVAVETVKWYIKQIYSKLGARNRDEAIRLAREQGLLSPAEPAIQETSASYVPLPATSLVGRHAELDEICAYLLGPTVRLLTLIGPPGVGKTTLSLHAAARLKEHFSDGAFFVGLASISDPFHMPAAIAAVLSLGASEVTPTLQGLLAFLQDKQCLLVLDNFEHIMRAAEMISALLEAIPYLKIMVTSREVLHLSSEQQYVVPPLAVPDLDQAGTLEALARVDAVNLYVQRAQAVKRTFVLTEENAPTVAELCIRLEGLPLALELAAARIKVYAPAELLAHLRSHLDVLKAQVRDRPNRQQTLRAAIDWSYALLDEEEKRLFRRIAIFQGGCTLQAVVSVCGTDYETEVVDLLEALVDQSLVTVRDVADESAGGEPRFGMLEMIRQYGLEKLDEAGEQRCIVEAHVHYFAALAAEAQQHWDSREQVVWLDRCERDVDNFRAVLSWCLEHDLTLAAQMAGQLREFWKSRGLLAEADRWYETILAHGDRLSDATRAKVFPDAMFFAHYIGDQRRAEARLAEGERLALTVGDAETLANLYAGAAVIIYRNPPLCQQYAEQALRIARASKQTPVIKRTLLTAHRFLGASQAAQGKLEAGLAHMREAYDVSEGLGSIIGMVVSLHGQAVLLSHFDHHAQAEEICRRALALAKPTRTVYPVGARALLVEILTVRGKYHEAIEQGELAQSLKLGEPGTRARCAGVLAHAYWKVQMHQKAVERLRQSLPWDASDDPLLTAYGLALAAVLIVEQEGDDRVACWLGTAVTLHSQPPYPLWPVAKLQYADALAIFQARLGAEALEGALAEGRATSVEQACGEALARLEGL